jgi:hypothetical protein
MIKCGPPSTEKPFKRHPAFFIGGITVARHFANWEVPEKPDTEYTRLLEKAFTDVPLTAEEKDRMPAFSAGSSYKLSGWEWMMTSAKQLRRILAKVEHYGWQEYYAVSKTHLRRKVKGIQEMAYIKRRGA